MTKKDTLPEAVRDAVVLVLLILLLLSFRIVRNGSRAATLPAGVHAANPAAERVHERVVSRLAPRPASSGRRALEQARD